MRAGDLVCVDADAIGYLGYAVDFSRTFVCSGTATSTQRQLFSVAYELLQHNASLLTNGRSYEELARKAWSVPSRFQPYGYYRLVHAWGCGVSFPTFRLPQRTNRMTIRVRLKRAWLFA